MSVITHTYRGYGYERIETPCVEDIRRLTSDDGGENEKLVYRILRRGLDAEILPGTETARLVDLGLRFDLTVPLTRFYAHNHAHLPTPFRALQIGPVWRAERPQKGRYRQFTQCDIDLLGEPTVLAEAELVEATMAALTALGLTGLTVRISDRRILAAMAAAVGIPADRTPGLFITLDKLDKIGWDGVREELVRRGFTDAIAQRCLTMVGQLRETSAGRRWNDLPAVLPELAGDVVADLTLTTSCLSAAWGEKSWEFDPTLVRGMGYYTGQIFEVAHPASASSIAGGGRYDRLVGKSLGRDVPACGFSLGFERIVELVERPARPAKTAVLVDDDVPLAEALATARRLRGDGEPVEVVRRRGSLGKQFAQLEDRGFTAAVRLRQGEEAQTRPLGKSRAGS